MQDYTGLYGNKQDYTGLYRTIQDNTEFYFQKLLTGTHTRTSDRGDF